MLESALGYLRRGFSVIPIGAGAEGKAPLIKWEPYIQRKPTEDEVVLWWVKWPYAGIGIVTGAVSGISVVDVDPRHGGVTDGLPPTRIARTQQGGWHYYYKYRPGMRNSGGKAGEKLGLPPGIDLRSDKGFVVAPPTQGKFGNYTWEDETVELAEYPEAYVPHEPEFDFDDIKYKPAKKVDSSTGSNIATDRPGDDYDSRTTWKEVLEPHGWGLVKEDEKGRCLWSRPGKHGRSTSATTNYDGCGLFYVFSTNADPFENEVSYSKFGVYAILNHGGNFREAAAELAAAVAAAVAALAAFVAAVAVVVAAVDAANALEEMLAKYSICSLSAWLPPP